MPRSRTTPPAGPFASCDGLPWLITDEALGLLNTHLATWAPERGAALLGPPGARLVTDVLPDPRPGQRDSYWHSDELRHALTERLSRDGTVTYRGTAHSHPGGLAAPSEPDRRAFRSTLDANPRLGDLLFPIVVDRAVDDLAPGLCGEHLIALTDGTVAGFTALADGRSTTLHRVRLSVLPARAVATAIELELGWAPSSLAPVQGPGGLPWIEMAWTGPDGTPGAQLLLPTSFPVGAPLLRAEPGAGFSSPAWDPTDPHPADRIVAALVPATQALAPAPCVTPQAPPSRPPATATYGEEERHARLAYHLPERGNPHVTLLGAGSMGSLIAEALVRSGVRRLSLIDPDTVEAANLSRTIYVTDDIGQAKVLALADRLSAIDPAVELDPVVGTSSTWLAATRTLDTDLVMLATDDVPAELAVNQRVFPQGVPLISAKMFARGDAGEILLAVPGEGRACLRCLTGSRGAPTGRTVDYGSGRLVAELALGPDIAVTAMRSAKIALALLSRAGRGGPLADWLGPILAADQCMLLSANIAQWGIFAHLGPLPGGMNGPFPSLWVTTAAMRDSSCPTCGDGHSDTRGDGFEVLTPLLALPDECTAEV